MARVRFMISNLKGTTHRTTCLSSLLLALTGWACGPAAKPSSAPPPAPPPPPAEHVPPPVAEPVEPPLVKILANVGLETPESVAFDKNRDVYLVSNTNGKPVDKDKNGFISRVTPSGDLTLRFIESGKEGVELDAPKGLTISDDVLYVADIDKVRKFDLVSGKPLGSVSFPDATFLNDVATGKDGQIYVTDSGLTPEFESNGTDAIYVLKGDKTKKLIAGKHLGSPNGIIAGDGGVWVTTFKSGEIYWVSDGGKRSKVAKMPGGGNDGIVATKDGRIVVSSWEANSLYIGEPDGTFVVELSGVESPADIGYDCERNRVLVPLFTKDTIVFHELSPPGPSVMDPALALDSADAEKEATEPPR